MGGLSRERKVLTGRLRQVSIFLALAGLLDSIYLAWLKLTGSLAACGEIGNCEAVNSSSYAEVAGVPVALLGALGYVAILALLLLEVRIEAGRGVLHLAQFGFTLAGTMYSAYLTYVEIAILRAICPYCVVSAVIMTALWIISSVRLWRLA